VIALDTNVLARYLLADETSQAKAARALIEGAEAEFWIPVTVVLELVWVLRAKKVPGEEIAARLRELLALRGMRPQMPDAVFHALRWAEQGMDIADALHLALSGKAERFATFDEDLVKRARKLDLQPPASRA